MTRNFVKLENGSFGIHSEITNIFTECNRIITKKEPEEAYEEIDESAVPEKTKKFLIEMIGLREERINRQKEIDSIKNTIKELAEKQSILETERTNFLYDIERLVKEYSEEKAFEQIKDTVDGTEIEDMSFYKGTLNRIRAKAIILKTDRPIVYTYGFTYRNPTTYRVPKTLEEALDIVAYEGYLDITFLESEIHLNAFSSNDMW